MVHPFESAETLAEILRAQHQSDDVSSQQMVKRKLTRNQLPIKADQAAPYERYFSKDKKKREIVDDWRAVLDMAGESAPAPVYARLSQALRNQGNLNAADTVTRQGIARHPDDLTLVQECEIGRAHV